MIISWLLTWLGGFLVGIGFAMGYHDEIEAFAKRKGL